METYCIKDPDGNADDFVLQGYGSCALQFTQRQFDQSVNTDPDTGYKQINLYVNHPTQMNSWIEVCQTVRDKLCETTKLQQGFDYQLVNNPNFEVRYIFENDSPDDQIFQLDYMAQLVTINVTSDGAS